MPTAGFRTVLEAPGRWTAHCVYEAKETGHSAAGVQCGTGAHSARAGRHSAGRQPVQVALLQGFRRALQGLHYSKVRVANKNKHLNV